MFRTATNLMLRCRLSLRCSRVRAPAQLFHFRQLHSTEVSVLQEITARGLLQNLTTSPPEFEKFFECRRVVYCGVDPTADSLHIGNLVPLITLLHFQLKGHEAIALLGGATGLIGDPSGRDTERPVQDVDAVEINSRQLQNQLHTFFSNATEYASKRIPRTGGVPIPIKFLNNLHWWKNMSFLTFLYSSCKHIRLSSMLSRESVKNRMHSASGISFSEFSYQVLQAYDFWHLYKHHMCTLQIGGSDQWGNILAGLDLIGRRESPSDTTQTFGLTTPLLTTSSGQKFGKSAGNAVWLDRTKTSFLDFYQFCLRTTDEDVKRYLLLFTLLHQDEIVEIMAKHETHPELRTAQHRLASEMTEMVHGVNAVAQAQSATRLLFSTDLTQIQPEEVEEALRYDPRYFTTDKEQLIGVPLSKLAVISGLIESRAEAVRLMSSGGLYLNNLAVTDKNRKLLESDLFKKRMAILRKGKESHMVLSVKQ